MGQSIISSTQNHTVYQPYAKPALIPRDQTPLQRWRSLSSSRQGALGISLAQGNAETQNKQISIQVAWANALNFISEGCHFSTEAKAPGRSFAHKKRTEKNGS
ncbi:hypothetical protein BaRGS_00013769 [Batillaria attramentaria]|uniref:Uncharacterized protein n=1 Tax=Batillaria attramentaria TaxID=370345 RepID=A0ABD0L6W5_9CAEN